MRGTRWFIEISGLRSYNVMADYIWKSNDQSVFFEKRICESGFEIEVIEVQTKKELKLLAGKIRTAGGICLIYRLGASDECITRIMK